MINKNLIIFTILSILIFKLENFAAEQSEIMNILNYSDDLTKLAKNKSRKIELTEGDLEQNPSPKTNENVADEENEKKLELNDDDLETKKKTKQIVFIQKKKKKPEPKKFDAPKRISKVTLLNKDIHSITTPTKVITRIKDIVSIEGIRDNQLIGYGIVVGLNGTGDKTQNSPFTKESLISMLERLGVNVRDLKDKIAVTNVAAVMVTANLPSFARRGNRIDISVSTLGTATSLMGGTLLPTTLKGADGEVYAIAQGEVTSSGFVVQGANVKTTKGVPTNGKIIRGAIVENELNYNLNDLEKINLSLHNPDFTTAKRIAEIINKYTGKKYHEKHLAFAKDQSTVSVRVPTKDIVSFITEIEQLHITPDNVAKVIFDDKEGVIVITENVKISPVVVTYGAMTVTVTEHHDYNNYSDDELKNRLATQELLIQNGHAGFHGPQANGVLQNDYYNSPYNNPYYVLNNNPYNFNPMFNQGLKAPNNAINETTLQPSLKKSEDENDFEQEYEEAIVPNSNNTQKQNMLNNFINHPSNENFNVLENQYKTKNSVQNYYNGEMINMHNINETAKYRFKEKKLARNSAIGISENGNVNSTIDMYNKSASGINEFENDDDDETDDYSNGDAEHSKDHAKYHMFNGATLQDLMNTLNAIGSSPNDMIAVLQVLKKSGAIQATLVSM